MWAIGLKRKKKKAQIWWNCGELFYTLSLSFVSYVGNGQSAINCGSCSWAFGQKMTFPTSLTICDY